MDIWDCQKRYWVIDDKGEYQESSLEESVYTEIPTQVYRQLAAHEYQRRESEIHGNVEIPVTEYNGLKKALKILQDKSYKAAERCHADEHGFLLLRCDKRVYYRKDRKTEYKALQIKRRTPVSASTDIGVAFMMVEGFLEEYYHYVPEIPAFMETHSWGWDDNEENKKFLVMYLQEYLNSKKNNIDVNYWWFTDYKNFLDRYDGKVIFDITELSPNYGSGYYEVTYWATGTI